MELDHLFVAVQVNANAVQATNNSVDQLLGSAKIARELSEQLTKHGFIEGSNNRHPGQGTANHRFFFDGFMLEFLYVDDVAGLMDERATQLGLFNRFSNIACSPFGIASRRSSAESSDANYSYSVYHPHYLPAHLQIQVAQGSDENEPLWFHLPFVSSAAESDQLVDKEPRLHANKASRLTSLVIELPFKPSTASSDIADMLNVRLQVSERHAAHLVFDDGCQGIQLGLSEDMSITIGI